MLRLRSVTGLSVFLSVLFIFQAGHAESIQSVTVEGGPIFSKHFQSGDENFHERHTLGIVKLETESHGNWALYYLGPNSVRNYSVGFGYVTDPYVVPLGPTQLELSGALGLVTGYQDYPVPLLAGEARLVVYKSASWDAGMGMAAMPYYARSRGGDDDDFGIVATTPFLSVRYNFQ